MQLIAALLLLVLFGVNVMRSFRCRVQTRAVLINEYAALFLQTLQFGKVLSILAHVVVRLIPPAVSAKILLFLTLNLMLTAQTYVKGGRYSTSTVHVSVKSDTAELTAGNAATRTTTAPQNVTQKLFVLVNQRLI